VKRPAKPAKSDPDGKKSALRVEAFPWLAASLDEENPQPIFRDRDDNMIVSTRENLPAALAEGLGKACGFRVLPYRLQDRYGRERRLREFRAVVMENGNLKATFLPELGGRLMSLYDKVGKRELLFKNPVFQPANLALRNAWFAGGIEWNIGQYGHAYHTCSPVFAAAIPGLNGEEGLRLYEYERCKGLLWQLDFYLPSGVPMLYAFTRVINTRDEETPMYWWSNVAVPEAPDVRVLAPATEAVYYDFGSPSYGLAPVVRLPCAGGKDCTYSTNFPVTGEYFFQCQEAAMPWEAALDAHGAGFIEASTYPLDARKLFCWGMQPGGRHWKDFLSVPGKGDYIEIQAGLAPTQQHTVPMPALEQWNWIQIFGSVQADPALVHGNDWGAACKAVEAALRRKVTPEALISMQAICAEKADTVPLRILSPGPGWGALEARRRQIQGEAAFPPAFAFPEATLGADQQPWMCLIDREKLPEETPGGVPGQWMVQAEWRSLLENSLKTPANRHWLAYLHLGVMKAEIHDDKGATAAWEESIRLRPSAWAWRNLGALAVRRGAPAEALASYEKAWELASAAGTPDVSFAAERLLALHAANQMEAAWSFFQGLPAPLQAADTTRLVAAKVALALGDLPFVENVLSREFTTIREGARDLTDLWFGLQARRRAAETGRKLDEALLEEVRKTCPLPGHLDFRMSE
jgi:hypothetical protein